MRYVLGILVVAGTAHAAPPASWNDLPALLTAAEARVDAELAGCTGKKPRHRIGIQASRAKDGSTSVGMPIWGLGHRGPTPEETCLGRTAAKLQLPPLPAEVDMISLGLEPGPTPPFDAWRDVPATLATLLDADKRTALAACDRKARTVQVILDVRKHATVAWLPAWQFHSDKGDGTTPPAQQPVKKCLSRVVYGWKPPLLPSAIGEIHLAIRTTP